MVTLNPTFTRSFGLNVQTKKYMWGYQDFSAGAITSTNVTLVRNDNGTDAPFIPSEIQGGTATIVNSIEDGYIYTGATKLFSSKIHVVSHNITSVTLSGIPHPSWGIVRIYFGITNFKYPEAYKTPSKFTSAKFASELGALFASQADLDAHTTSTNNPHNVTQGQVGLGNVQNVDTTNANNITTGTLANARLTSDVTLLGNVTNGANQLVSFDALGFYPTGNGRNITALNASNLAEGSVPSARLDSSVTQQGNVVNVANSLVKFDSQSNYPAGKGTNITDIPLSSIIDIATTYATKQELTDVNDDYTTHKNSTSNPHNVTKAQVGLSNVTNVDSSNADNITSGTITNARLSSDVTLKGNSFNNANNLVQLDETGKIPATLMPEGAMGVPVGALLDFDRVLTSIPEGYLLVNGGEYNKADYPILYGFLAEKQGFVENSNPLKFNVPNLYSNRYFKRTGTQVGLYENDQFRSHSHTYGISWTYFGGGYNNAKQGDQYQGVFTQYRSTYSTGGSETRPYAYTVTQLIKHD